MEGKFEVKFDAGEPKKVVSVEFGYEGVKRYQNEVTSDGISRAMTFDGKNGHHRENGIVKHMAIGSGDAYRQWLDELPGDRLEVKSCTPENLAQALRGGYGKVVEREEVKLDGSRGLRLVIEASSKNLEIVYDIDRGFWVVSTKYRYEGGQIEIRDVRLAKFMVDGNEYYYPMSGKFIAIMDGGQHTDAVTCSMDPESVRINHDIPEDKFTMVSQDDEVVYDNNRKQYLQVPPQKLAIATKLNGGWHMGLWGWVIVGTLAALAVVHVGRYVFYRTPPA